MYKKILTLYCIQILFFHKSTGACGSVVERPLCKFSALIAEGPGFDHPPVHRFFWLVVALSGWEVWISCVHDI